MNQPLAPIEFDLSTAGIITMTERNGQGIALLNPPTMQIHWFDLLRVVLTLQLRLLNQQQQQPSLPGQQQSSQTQ